MPGLYCIALLLSQVVSDVVATSVEQVVETGEAQCVKDLAQDIKTGVVEVTTPPSHAPKPRRIEHLLTILGPAP